ncbi:hypothetical protein M422DRAFT_256148 [Sphaerobolus stellatus SS14]|uniref:Uncharacterized protein n=1 Tax=Sphaerobolus stellatus (strain SS14) TaxID=990650 RepID=A0A0C9VHU2_SPHS4|nr:hypothetical protein M422DRAFT_256148 [Sphaerobolus stellatus SS14]
MLLPLIPSFPACLDLKSLETPLLLYQSIMTHSAQFAAFQQTISASIARNRTRTVRGEQTNCKKKIKLEPASRRRRHQIVEDDPFATDDDEENVLLPKAPVNYNGIRASGAQGTSFTEKLHAEVYQRHLSSLEELKNRSGIHAHKLLRLRRHLYARAREHAGAAASINDRPLLDENDIDDFVTNSDPEDTESEDELSNSEEEEVE